MLCDQKYYVINWGNIPFGKRPAWSTNSISNFHFSLSKTIKAYVFIPLSPHKIRPTFKC